MVGRRKKTEVEVQIGIGEVDLRIDIDKKRKWDGAVKKTLESDTQVEIGPRVVTEVVISIIDIKF